MKGLRSNDLEEYRTVISSHLNKTLDNLEKGVF